MTTPNSPVIISLPYRVKAISMPLDIIGQVKFYDEKDYTVQKADGSSSSYKIVDHVINTSQEIRLILLTPQDEKQINAASSTYPADLEKAEKAEEEADKAEKLKQKAAKAAEANDEAQNTNKAAEDLNY